MQTILLVDDDEKLSDFITTFLTKEGYGVYALPNGKLVIPWLQQNTPDLILTDVIMPQTDGIEVLFHIRKHYPQIPVIAMSAGGKDTVLPADYCLDIMRTAGSCKCLTKPFHPQQLLQIIQETLQPSTPT